MRPTVSLIASLVVLVCLIAAPAGAGDPPQGEAVKITYIWQPGMTVYYRMIMDSRTKSVGDGSDREYRDRTAMMVRMEVYSVREDGTARVAMTYLRVRVEREDPTKGASVYDSAKAPNDKPSMESGIYGALVNKTLIVEITPEGRTMHVQGLDDLVEGMMKDSTKGDPRLAKSMEDSGLAKKMKDMFAQMTSQSLPSEQLLSGTARRVGEQWPVSRKLNLPTGDEMTMDAICKLESIDVVSGHRMARVSMNGKTSMNTPATPEDAKTAVPTPARDSSLSDENTFLFDLDRGRFVRLESHHTGTSKLGEMTVAGHTMPGSTMNSKMTMLMELVGPEDSIDPQSEKAPGK